MSPKEEKHVIDLEFDGQGYNGHSFATGRVHRIIQKTPVLLLHHAYHDDVPVANVRYEVELADGSTITGFLDEDGKAEVHGLHSRPLRVRYGADPAEYAIADDGSNPAYVVHFSKADADSLTAPADKRGTVQPPDAMSFGLEAVDWIWGTVKGGFNEKQTVSQIIVDAVIGMIPLVGDITAVRDILAIILGMARDPRKRESKLEWMGLVVLLFALIPVVGGAIKGVGKLLLKAGREAAQTSTQIRDIVAVLNRLGLGDAQAWFKALNLEGHLGEVLGRWHELTRRMEMVLDSVGTNFRGRLPEGMLRHLSDLKEKIQGLAKKGEEMIPDAVRELNERLKAAQRQVYNGDWHGIPRNLNSSTREVEARLVDVPGGRKWAVENMAFKPNGRASYFKWEQWPDLSDGKYVVKDPKTKKILAYKIIPCFSGPMRAVKIPPGTKIYRVVTGTGNAAGEWWVYALPGSGKEWREGLAVLDSWNKNGYFVELTVPDEGLLAWEGKAASQVENDPDAVKTMGQYLPGGQIQLFIDLRFEANAKAVDALSKKLEKPLDKILEKKPTPWTDAYNGLHVPDKVAEVDFLGPFEIESKNHLPATLVEKTTRRGRQQEE